jgi:hypothetical protein
MAITRFCCGFECNMWDDGSGATAPRHWHSQAGTAQSILTSDFKHGARCLQVANAGVASYARQDVQPAATQTVARARFYVKRTTTPAADAMAWGHSTAAGSFAYIRYQFSSGNFIAQFGTSTAAVGPAFAIDTWYRIDVEVRVGLGTRTIDWWVDGVAQTQATLVGTASTLAQMRFGNESTTALTTRYDSIMAEWGLEADRASMTALPFGEGKVLRHAPKADGTHGFNLAGDFRKGALSPATQVLTSAANAAPTDTDLYTYVDEVPDTLTEGAIQYGTPAQGEYVAFQFQDVTDVGESAAPRSVELIWRTHSATTTANLQGMRIDDNISSIASVVDSVDCSETSAADMGDNILPADGGGVWTTTKLANLRARWGPNFTGTLDISPVANLDAIMLEAEYAITGGGGGSIQPPRTMHQQRLRRAA